MPAIWHSIISLAPTVQQHPLRKILIHTSRPDSTWIRVMNAHRPILIPSPAEMGNQTKVSPWQGWHSCRLTACVGNSYTFACSLENEIWSTYALQFTRVRRSTYICCWVGHRNSKCYAYVKWKACRCHRFIENPPHAAWGIQHKQQYNVYTIQI